MLHHWTGTQAGFNARSDNIRVKFMRHLSLLRFCWVCGKLPVPAAPSGLGMASSLLWAPLRLDARSCRRASSLTAKHEARTMGEPRRRDKTHKRTDSSSRSQPAGRRVAAQATPSYPSQLHQQQQRPADNLFYYATCHPGLEEVVAAELASPNIRATNVSPGKAGVSFRCCGRQVTQRAVLSFSHATYTTNLVKIVSHAWAGRLCSDQSGPHVSGDA